MSEKDDISKILAQMDARELFDKVSLRAYIATAALQIVAPVYIRHLKEDGESVTFHDNEDNTDSEMIAEAAVQLADALLSELAK